MSRRLSPVQLGVLLTIAPLWVLVLPWLYGDATPDSLRVPGVLNLAVALAATLCFGALLAISLPRVGRVLITVSFAAGIAVAAPGLVHSPSLTLFVLLVVGSLIAWIWSNVRPDRRPREAPPDHTASAFVLGTSIGLFCVWFLGIPAALADALPGWGAVAMSAVLSLGAIVHWMWTGREAHPRRLILLWSVLTFTLALAAVFRDQPSLALSLPCLFGIGAGIGSWYARHRRLWERLSWWEPIIDEPARLLGLTFLITASLGGLILSLPAMSAHSGGASMLDAFFTAFSATCVTGLIVLDTPNDFTFMGQFVILALIQVGGLGIMTFYTATIALLGRRMSLKHETTAAELLSTEDRREIHRALRQILGVTFVTEALGALILTGLFFHHGDSLGMATWRGIFTAISAFCNAGFALQSDSLVIYQNSPLILNTIAIIIIIGGLSPLVVVALPSILRRGLVSVQVKLVVSATAILLVAPALFILAAEWTQTLGGMTLIDGFTNGWFQSVTLRTAGFNSIDLAQVRPATLVVMMVMMFIGGSPGSTAGGIKTTTVAILVLVIVAAMRGRDEVSAFGYRIAMSSMFKAAAVGTLGMFMVFVVLVAIALTQTMPFDTAVFETISALATVGLSVGGTDELDSVGKVIIIFAMFIGRVGPLTLFLLLAQRTSQAVWQRPEHQVTVG